MHNEARKLLIQALERSHNVREVARNYCVNRSTVYRLKKRLDETGSIETRTYLRGRKPALTPEEVENINQLVKTRLDITKRSLFMPVNSSVPDVVQKRKDWKGLTDRTLAGLHPAFYSKMQFFLSSCRLLFLGR